MPTSAGQEHVQDIVYSQFWLGITEIPYAGTWVIERGAESCCRRSDISELPVPAATQESQTPAMRAKKYSGNCRRDDNNDILNSAGGYAFCHPRGKLRTWFVGVDCADSGVVAVSASTGDLAEARSG
jgi:hypothetical protein